tara:strand:+ start:105 stop:395 length:291 start_codon:yes stop_codon:yes gene_type:complete
MSELKSVELASISKIQIFFDRSEESINKYIDLGWKLLNINNVIEIERNLETGEYERLSVTQFTLGWLSELGEVRFPNEDDKSEDTSALEPFDPFNF